jgi:hypothetical protein
MTSKIKVDNINKVSDDSNIIKKCGTTTTIGSGASNPIVVDGSTVTLGRCGGTVALASGATQTGFGRTGTVDWQTTPKTATFTAVSGEGYFANTSGGAFTMNLPAGSGGAIVSVADYAATWQTNNLTISANGTEKIGGVASTPVVLSTEGQSVTLVYVDSTQGWINTMDSTSNVRAAEQYNVQYLVVAGGGGGGTSYGGGGGAGGYRTLASKTFAVLSDTSFPITVGAGGTSAPTPPSPSPELGLPGSNSIFSTITSAGGGGGSGYSINALNGGSGGGGSRGPGGTGRCSGAGNTPPVSPPQGNPGAPTPSIVSGGGGGAGGAGAAGSARNGGIGSSYADLGPLAPSYGTPGPAPGRYFSGGGGGYINGTGGSGGGATAPDTDATVNTGGGGSGCGSGGSGIVIIRYVTADASPNVSGGNATTTCGSDTIRVFTGPGTFVS